MEYKYCVFSSPIDDQHKEEIEIAKNVASHLELDWDTQSDVIHCWIGSYIDIEEKDSRISIYLRNENPERLIIHIVEYYKERQLWDIHNRLRISFFDLRYKNRN